MKQEQTEDKRLKGIKSMQDRKDYAIAFYNSTNSAIEMLKMLNKDGELAEEDMQFVLTTWRDWFLEEHAKYRALVTEKVGVRTSDESRCHKNPRKKLYNAGEAIKRLENTTNAEELQQVWKSFSQDERIDKQIHAKCVELKNKYENIL